MKPGVLGEWKDPNDCDFSRVFTRHVDHEYAKLMRTENIETGNAKKDRKNRYKSVNRRIKVITKERRDQRTPEFYQEYPRLDAHWCGAWGGFGHLERSERCPVMRYHQKLNVLPTVSPKFFILSLFFLGCLARGGN